MNDTSYFTVTVSLPRSISEENLEREDLLEIWGRELHRNREKTGFLGIHEGSASASNLVLDDAAPPPERDWVAEQDISKIEFYFSNRESADAWAKQINSRLKEKFSIQVLSEKNRDWNERWRESFTGIDLPPYWKIIPAWNKTSEASDSTLIPILLSPGLGFGSGTHPTTQLCLEILGEQKTLLGKKVLDFGAGSGILAVAAAKLGAEVDAVEIDEMALNAAKECAEINGVADKIRFYKSLPADDTTTYNFIVANILRSVLIEFSGELLRRLKPDGRLSMSGLLQTDVDDVSQAYQRNFISILHRKSAPSIREKNTWYRVDF